MICILLLITFYSWGNITIYICKKDAKLSSLLSLYSFLHLIKDELSIEHHIYMNRNKCDLYEERFGKMLSVFYMKCHLFGHKYVINYKHLRVLLVFHIVP